MSHQLQNLQSFLEKSGQPAEFDQLTADASTREYFRFDWNGESAVACVYPEGFDADTHPYIDATRLFEAAGLPVAHIYAVDGELGVIVLEDLGDRILRDEMMRSVDETSSRQLDEAIALIAQIQAATGRAYQMNSIASHLKFDREKLLWELRYFKEHYFETFQQRPLNSAENERLAGEFEALAGELEATASVLCHRDFHAANLMLDNNGRMRIIDHQDARIGSATYDLISLLLDRITHLPSTEWLAEKRKYFLEVRRKLGLPHIDEDEFAHEFRLQTIQRCLKAAGTFSFQAATRGKDHFIPFIKPMFRISLRGAQSLGRFPAIQEILGREIR